MAVKFNPFTGQLQIDEKGSGGGSSYIDGEVQNFSALPETLGSPAVDSAYLVREAEGAWLLNRKPAGIYIRTANTGTRASDWTYAGEFPDVFNDANLVVYNNTDSTKNVKFDASAIATGTTRTISVPNNDVTLPDQGTSTTDSPNFAGATINQSGTWGLTVPSGATETNTAEFTGDSTNYNLIRVLNTDGGSSFYMACTGSGYSGSNFGESNAGQASLEVNGGGTNQVGLIGNRNGPLCLGADDQVQLRLDSNGTTISDPTDITKKVRLSAASVTAGQTRIVTFPDKNISLDDAGDARTPTAHNHNASDINAGTLAHERGGLEADVSAYSGLVKISGGATSAVTVSATGENLIGAADAAAARSAISAAEASHTHELTALAATGATNGHVLTANGSGGVTFAAASGGGSGGTKTYAFFAATGSSNQPPATNFAVLDTRNSIACLGFRGETADDSAIFVGVMPEGAVLSSGLQVRLHWMSATQTSGNVRWQAHFQRCDTGTDLDTDSFDANASNEATGTASSTLGAPTITTITCGSGAIDGIVAGDAYRLRITREQSDTTLDTMGGLAQLIAVEVRSAA